MKAIFHLTLTALLFFAVTSCKKSDFSSSPPDNPPLLSAKIFHFIAEPSSMEMGTSNSIITQGDWVTVFVPYEINNEGVYNAKLTVTDDATGTAIAEYDLLPSTDASTSSIEIPDDYLNHTLFLFARFNADNSFAGKTISLHTTVQGMRVTSQDDLAAALIVQ